jgi:hypothetical protein
MGKGVSVALACLAIFTLASVPAMALTDGSFEAPGIPAWTTFNSALQLAAGGMASGAPQNGNFVLQAYGPFVSNWDASGAYQQVAASPGQTWTVSGYAMNPTGDPLQAGGLSFGTLQLAWVDSANAIISTIDSAHIGQGQSLGVWTLLSATGVAPAGTVGMRAYALHVNSPANESGSIYFDNLSAVPEPGTVGLVLTGLLGLAAVGWKKRTA